MALKQGLLAMVMAATVSCAASEKLTLGLKTLLVCADNDDCRLPKNIMEAYDTPYEISEKAPATNSADYHAIVVCSELEPELLEAVREYARTYNIRVAYLDSKPENAGAQSQEDFKAKFLSMDPSDEASFAVDCMCTSCFWDATTKEIEARPAVASSVSGVPIMRFSTDEEQSATDPVAAAIFDNVNGTEEMHFMFKAVASQLDDDGDMEMEIKGEYTYLNTALGNVWFQWVTRGVYLGKRHIYLQPQVDDWLAASTLWTGKDFRCDGGDARHAAEFSKNLTERLPEGSWFKFELGFNGAGFAAMGLEEQGMGVGLSEESERLRHEFLWVSHTWTHQNLDWKNADTCGGKSRTCQLPYDRVEEELVVNDKFFRGEAVPANSYRSDLNKTGMRDSPAGHMFANDSEGLKLYYSPNGLIPPEISGLWPASAPPTEDFALPKNTIAMKAMTDFGIRTVTGDNSRDELLSKVSRYHGVLTTVEEYGYAGILITPRHAPNIDWDTHDPEDLTDYYNKIGACSWSFGAPCKGDLTFEQIMKRESDFATFAMLQYRPDPYMFHQANLHTFPYKGGQHSLLTMFVELAVDRFLTYIDKLPITSQKFEDCDALYRERMARDSCNVVASMDVEDGEMTAVRVQGDGNCTAVLTINSQTNPALTLTGADSVESYAFDRTYKIALDGNQVALSVEGAEITEFPPSTTADPDTDGLERAEYETTTADVDDMGVETEADDYTEAGTTELSETETAEESYSIETETDIELPTEEETETETETDTELPTEEETETETETDTELPTEEETETDTKTEAETGTKKELQDDSIDDGEGNKNETRKKRSYATMAYLTSKPSANENTSHTAVAVVSGLFGAVVLAAMVTLGMAMYRHRPSPNAEQTHRPQA